MAASWVIREFLPNTTSSVPLTDNQVSEGKTDLVKIVKGLPRLNKRYIDPPIQGQTYGLVSFIPAQGAKANEKGFYGYVKFRGNYDNIPDCSNRIDYIIRNVDSTNHIHVCRVGEPVPLVTKGYAEEVDEVDVKREAEKDMSAMSERKRRRIKRRCKR